MWTDKRNHVNRGKEGFLIGTHRLEVTRMSVVLGCSDQMAAGAHAKTMGERSAVHGLDVMCVAGTFGCSAEILQTHNPQ